MVPTLQQGARYLGVLIAGALLGYALHAYQDRARETVAVRVEAAQQIKKRDDTQAWRTRQKARAQAAGALAEAAVQAAAASHPDWANTPVPQEVIDALSLPDPGPAVDGLRDNDQVGTAEGVAAGLPASSPAGSPE